MKSIRRVAAALLLVTTGVLCTGIGNAGASTFYVGQGSSDRTPFINAFNRAGGSPWIGSPINTVHRWNSGCIQDFVGGWSGKAGIMQANCAGPAYNVVYKQWAYIESRWGSNATNEIGYPTGHDMRVGNGWIQHFAGGSWRNATLARADQTGTVRAVRGDTRAFWLANGGPTGRFGYPLGEDYPWNGVYKQDFQGGSIIWDIVNKARQYNPAPPVATREQKAVAWAIAEKNSPNPRWSDEFGRAWSGYCEGFAEVAFGVRSQFYSAYQHYTWQLNNGRIHTDTNPPAGALVFYGGGNGFGHIGVSIGSGQVVSTQGYDGQYLPVWQHSVAFIGNYLGWAYAPSNWPGR